MARVADVARADSQSTTISGTVVTYRAVIRVVRYGGEPIRTTESEKVDLELAEKLWPDREFRTALDEQARAMFGSQFRVLLLDSRPRSSVELKIALYANHRTTIAIESFRDQIGLFCETVRTTIRLAIDERLYDVAIDVTPQALSLPAVADRPSAQGAWERLSPVLGAVVGGLGVLGFVTFVGGAIEFARLRSAGLPAEEAVAVIPTANLITIGARALVPALGFALGVAAALYVWELAAARTKTIEGLTDRATKVLTPRKPGTRAALLAGLVLVLEILWFATALDIEVGTFLWFLLLAAASSGAVLLVALRVRKFLWVAATAFVAVGVFAGVLEYKRADEIEEVRPAAVIREGDPTTGFFIAETPSQVYLGRQPIRDTDEAIQVQDSRIIVLSKDEVSDLSIGPLLEPQQAFDRATLLASELCAIRVHEPVREIAQMPRDKRSPCDRVILRESR